MMTDINPMDEAEAVLLNIAAGDRLDRVIAGGRLTIEGEVVAVDRLGDRVSSVEVVHLKTNSTAATMREASEGEVTTTTYDAASIAFMIRNRRAVWTPHEEPEMIEDPRDEFAPPWEEPDEEMIEDPRDEFAPPWEEPEEEPTPPPVPADVIAAAVEEATDAVEGLADAVSTPVYEPGAAFLLAHPHISPKPVPVVLDRVEPPLLYVKDREATEYVLPIESAPNWLAPLPGGGTTDAYEPSPAEVPSPLASTGEDRPTVTAQPGDGGPELIPGNVYDFRSIETGDEFLLVYFGQGSDGTHGFRRFQPGQGPISSPFLLDLAEWCWTGPVSRTVPEPSAEPDPIPDDVFAALGLAAIETARLTARVEEAEADAGAALMIAEAVEGLAYRVDTVEASEGARQAYLRNRLLEWSARMELIEQTQERLVGIAESQARRIGEVEDRSAADHASLMGQSLSISEAIRRTDELAGRADATDDILDVVAARSRRNETALLGSRRFARHISALIAAES